MFLLLACITEAPGPDSSVENTVQRTISTCTEPEGLVNPMTFRSTDLLGEEVRALGNDDIGPEDLMHMITTTNLGPLTLMGGTGGLLVVDSSGETPQVIGRHLDTDRGRETLVQLHTLPNGQVLASDQGGKSWLFDLSDPTSPQRIAELDMGVVTGIDHDETATWVLTADGELYRWANALQRVTDGLVSPRDLVVQDGLALVAERGTGLTVVDLATGAHLSTLPTLAPPTDLERHEDRLYVAIGSHGLEVWDIADFGAPELLRSVDLPGTANDLAISRDQLWVATIDGVANLDLDGTLLAHRATPEFALAVAPSWGGVLVADWSFMHQVWGVDATPVADLSHTELAVASSATVQLSNPSSQPLEVLYVGSDELTVSGGPMTLEPSETTSIGVELNGAAEGTVCIVTNDPHQPVIELSVSQGDGIALSVGQQAPSFELTDLDGKTWALDDYRGRPVVLVFFATWCPICPPELDDLEARAHAWDAEVWLVAPVDTPSTLRAFVEERGITLPVLVDDGTVYAEWQQSQDFQTLFPQNWVVGPDGTIVYAANHYSADALEDAVQTAIRPID